MGLVDIANSSEIKGFSASACKKKGSSSTVERTPVPAFGERDLPSARRNAACVMIRVPLGRTAQAIDVPPSENSPSYSGSGKSLFHRARAPALAISDLRSGGRISARARPPLRPADCLLMTHFLMLSILYI